MLASFASASETPPTVENGSGLSRYSHRLLARRRRSTIQADSASPTEFAAFPMLARHFAFRARRSFRATVGWFAAMWYVTIAIGLPLPLAGGKDLSRPFLCMYSRCGCQNAEQCYRRCCCHTAAERLAFARSHGDVPPPELLAMVEAETSQIAVTKRSCCSDKGCTAPATEPSPGDLERNSYSEVVIQDSLACRGVGHLWQHTVGALPPPVIELTISIVEIAVCPLSSHSADTLLPAPPSPPPRVG